MNETIIEKGSDIMKLKDVTDEELFRELDDRFRGRGKVTLSYLQKDAICYQIGEWYVKWKVRIVAPHINHRLGYAKEELKEMICGSE